MHKTKKKHLTLSKETIRQLIPSELNEIGGGLRASCGGASACDCSGTTFSSSTVETVGTDGGSVFCTKPQY